MHTSLDDGALFDQLDALTTRSQFEVVGCTLTHTVALLPIYSSLMTNTFPQCSFEDGECCVFSIVLAHLGLLFLFLEADTTTLGSKFQDYQVSFGPDLR